MSAGDDKRPRRGLTEEERTLWQGVTRSIMPLKRARKKPTPVGNDTLATETAPAPVARKHKPSQVSPKSAAKPAPALAPLEKRAKQRLARGVESIDARLDLHGKTQSQAHGALLRFLRRVQADEARYVLVITGKGARGDTDRGVLKRQVPLWLTQPEFRVFVIGFEDAHVGHGGEGALYVRVRRARAPGRD